MAIECSLSKYTCLFGQVSVMCYINLLGKMCPCHKALFDFIIITCKLKNCCTFQICCKMYHIHSSPCMTNEGSQGILLNFTFACQPMLLFEATLNLQIATSYPQAWCNCFLDSFLDSLRFTSVSFQQRNKFSFFVFQFSGQNVSRSHLQ